MAVAAEIARSYLRPRDTMRRQLAGPRREDRLLAYLLVGCGMIFVAQWPIIARQAQDNPGIPLEVRLGGALQAWLVIAPLLLYLLAALSHVIARLFGGKGTWYGARLALFWSLLVVAPLWLLDGALAVAMGPGLVQDAVGIAAFTGFLVIWIVMLREAEAEHEWQ